MIKVMQIERGIAADTIRAFRMPIPKNTTAITNITPPRRFFTKSFVDFLTSLG